MKKNILTFALIGVIIAMTGFALAAQESPKAAKAKKDLKEAKIDSATDFKKFKKEAEIKIRVNQIQIVALKAKQISDTKEVPERYHKQVLVLEQKNNQLENRIKKSDYIKTTMWGAFKRHFNHDMEELDEAFRDLSSNDTK